ncbi:hypothetical protein AN958_01015 [Leucoagaricus sp. SymC.cos]|nr:hypothetical protein AN958_01015 [Leucoagaricus sp. SymC.cos]
MFKVTKLGNQRAILGIPWLIANNSTIDWKHQTLTLVSPEEKYQELLDSISDEILYLEENDEEDKLNLKVNTMMELAQKYTKQQLDNPIDIVPEEYYRYMKIFSDKEAKRFPPAQKWDHRIELLPSFEPKAFPNYKLAPKEMEELDKFLDKNLKKKYIQPSKLPMASPFFFVGKKDRKLRPCQDY